MISNLRPEREDFQAKQEGDDQNANENQTLIVKPQSSTTSSSRQWGSAFRNPRIVRASRCFGGKDRHSKVCTVRGLRDRRIRLSVPTAVQLYDLQDRLGLNQPSKVVDWLLDAAKDDVDKLPPLQFPQGFDRLYPNMAFGVHDHNQNWDNFSSSLDVDQVSSRQDLEIGGSSLRPRNYKDEEKLDIFGLEKGKWIKEGNDDEHDDHHPQHHDDDNISMEQSSRDKSHTGLINHPTMAYNPYNHHHLDPSHLSLSQLGNNSCPPQLDVSLNTRSNLNMSYPVMNSILPSGSSQLFLYPPTTTNISTGFPAYPPFVMAQLGDGNENVRRLNQLFQLSNSNPQQIVWSSNNMRPFHHLMNVNPGFEDMHRNRSNDDNNDSNNV